MTLLEWIRQGDPFVHALVATLGTYLLTVLGTVPCCSFGRRLAA
jgi:hypothetical protein